MWKWDCTNSILHRVQHCIRFVFMENIVKNKIHISNFIASEWKLIVQSYKWLNIYRLGEAELLHFHDCKCRRKRAQISRTLISTFCDVHFCKIHLSSLTLPCCCLVEIHVKFPCQVLTFPSEAHKTLTQAHSQVFCSRRDTRTIEKW